MKGFWKWFLIVVGVIVLIGMMITPLFVIGAVFHSGTGIQSQHMTQQFAPPAWQNNGQNGPSFQRGFPQNGPASRERNRQNGPDSQQNNPQRGPLSQQDNQQAGPSSQSDNSGNAPFSGQENQQNGPSTQPGMPMNGPQMGMPMGVPQFGMRHNGPFSQWNNQQGNSQMPQSGPSFQQGNGQNLPTFPGGSENNRLARQRNEPMRLGSRVFGGFLMLPFLGLLCLFSLAVIGFAIYGVVALVNRPKAVKSEPIPHTEPCVKCGKPIQDDWSSCPYCGQKVRRTK